MFNMDAPSNQLESNSSSSAIRLTPAGHLHLRSGWASPAVSRAFDEGAAAGLLALLKHNVQCDASVEFWSAFAQEFLRTAADRLTLEGVEERREVPICDGLLELWLERAPLFDGEEYLSAEVLSCFWNDLAAHFRSAETGEAWLASLGAQWSALGRICLHLAENKADPEFPFAFLATVANRVAQNGRIIFSPLGKAVKEAEAQGNRARLLALLEPLARAEKKATWLSEIVASREVFHPLAWNPSEAFAFLSSIPDLETSGLQVKVPNWWARNRGKVQAKVTVGQTATGSLNAGVLLSFDVGLAIGDEDLTNEERAALFSSSNVLGANFSRIQFPCRSSYSCSRDTLFRNSKKHT